MDSSGLHQVAPKKFFPSGKSKVEYKPKELCITWGNDKRYWNIKDEAAELLQVSWLEVTGTLAADPEKNYKISFEISLEPHAFGWEGIEIHVMAKFGRLGQYTRNTFPLDDKIKTLTVENSKSKVLRRDNNDCTLYFGLYEVFSGVWKGGLKIHKAVVEKF